MTRNSVGFAVLSMLTACCINGCGEPHRQPGVADNHVMSSSTKRSERATEPAEFMAPPATNSRSDDVVAATPKIARATDDGVRSSVEATSKDVESFADFDRSADEKAFVPKSGRQSGILTAGSFDDVAKFTDFVSFLRRSRRHVAKCNLPLPPYAQQTLITVTDGRGRPLGNVRCVVKQQGDGQIEHVLLDMHTGTDGRVMLLSDARAHHPQQAPQLRLQVFLDDQPKAVIDEYRERDCQWPVTVQNVVSALPTRLDLALVVDTTGSMGDELEYLKTEIDSIVASVGKMFPNIDQRYALVTYRDNGDEYVCRSFDFTGSLSDFRRNLDAQSANGGGDFPEAMDVALKSAEQLSWRNGNTARVLFLVGDAPPHPENTASAMSAVTGLRQQGVRVFPVGASGVEKTAEVVMRTASLLTMGQYLFLTDHSGVGNPHATPDVPAFAVERLDRLMLRMIASELAGKRLVAQEVIAIERGEHYSCVPPTQIQSRPRVQSQAIQPPMMSCYVVEPPSAFAGVLQWIGQNGLATILAIVSGIIVFERLSKFCSVSQA